MFQVIHPLIEYFLTVFQIQRTERQLNEIEQNVLLFKKGANSKKYLEN